MSGVKQGRGIVLRKTKYGESDLIIQMILVSGEKISLMAKGALRSKKRFAGGVLDPTQYVQVQYRDQGSHKLGLLEEASVLEGFEGLRTDYDRMDLALYILSSISKISQEGDSLSESLFNLLGHMLRSLQTAERFDQFRAVFCLKILHQQGVLELEPWMSPALLVKFKNWSQAEPGLKINSLQVHWAENKLSQYLQTAGAHGEKF
jgi:DNA repair protein RecO (recombination protein O)